MNEDIIERFLERYPSSETSDAGYPNRSVFTKERVISEVVKINLGFQKMLDSGRHSGGRKDVT